jgi:hypothetical protein
MLAELQDFHENLSGFTRAYAVRIVHMDMELKV